MLTAIGIFSHPCTNRMCRNINRKETEDAMIDDVNTGEKGLYLVKIVSHSVAFFVGCLYRM
jgi:hypothetical protein